MSVRSGDPRRVVHFDEPGLVVRRRGLEPDGRGGLRLAELPAPSVAPRRADAPATPGGLTVARDGWIYAADPDGDRIVAFDPCDRCPRTLPCLRGPGGLPGELREPHGVLAGPRGALYVADTGNHRVQVIDLAGGSVRAVWGPPARYAEPASGAGPGLLSEPWAVVAVGDLVRVADRDGGRVQTFTLDGADEGAEALPGPGPAPNPTGIAATPSQILVLDAAAGSLLPLRALSPAGGVDASATARWSAALAPELAGIPVGLAVGGAVYVGDPAGERIVALSLDAEVLGSIPFPGPIAALAVDREDHLLVHGGGEALTLLDRRARVAEGRFLVGPVPLPVPTEPWSGDPPRLLVRAATEGDAGLRLATLTAATRDEPPAPRDPSLDAPPPEGSAPLGAWRAGPPRATELLARNALPWGFPETSPDAFVWVAGLLAPTLPGAATVERLEVELADRSWIRHLPALYRSDPVTRELLEPMLLLFEGILDEADAAIDGLPVLMDPAGTPDDGGPDSWLDWLGGWVGVELDERWSPERRREAVAGAFARHGRRGTVPGVREACRRRLGVDVRIEEPAGAATAWVLDGEHSVLGLTTMTTAAEAQGAVLDASATLDASHLIERRRYGAPLFADLAHRFVVRVHAAEVPCEEDVARLRAVLDDEKPAHTAYELCVIAPGLRVGRSARIGVDAVVGDPRRRQDQETTVRRGS